jgi:hypothetical protein
MTKKTINTSYSAYASLDELAETDVTLIEKAIDIARKSYSPARFSQEITKKTSRIRRVHVPSERSSTMSMRIFQTTKSR